MAEASQLRNHIDLAQYAGFPVHFFDYRFLRANVPIIATWNADKLETVIGARTDNMLSRADVRLPVRAGFYIIFCTHEPKVAQERTNAVSTDILKHFFGTESLIPEGANAFTRAASLNEIAADLGIAPPPPQAASSGGAGAAIDGQPSLIADMNALFRQYFGEQQDVIQKFLFAPIWDSVNERIASFSCQPALPGAERNMPAGEKSAADHCANDIAALAFGMKGVWHLLTRGDLALVTVPVHIETLSWSKHRAAYLHELGNIEPKVLGLLAFRICGLDPGASLSQLSQGVSVLRRHARRIFVHLANTNADFSHAGILGVTGIGVSMPAPDARGDTPLDSLPAVATRLKRICAGQNAIAYVANVASPAHVNFLKGQGVRLIAGPVFGPPSEEPGPARALSLHDICAAPRSNAKAIPA
jgi:hypothetical protein